MSKAVTLIGSPVSPYVRKIMAILEFKNISYEIDPFPPFFGGDEFTMLSPLRRVPVLIEDGAVILDSSVIAQYLEETRPAPSILPAGPVEKARARWIEEFSDSRLADVFIWRGFAAMTVFPRIFGAQRDVAAFEKTLAEDVPQVMDILEAAAPTEGFLSGGDIGLADISAAVMFRNMAYARWMPDAARWPRTAAWVARAEIHPALARPTALADALIRLPIDQLAGEARARGFAVVSRSLATATPRKGPMTAHFASA